MPRFPGYNSRYPQQQPPTPGGSATADSTAQEPHRRDANGPAPDWHFPPRANRSNRQRSSLFGCPGFMSKPAPRRFTYDRKTVERQLAQWVRCAPANELAYRNQALLKIKAVATDRTRKLLQISHYNLTELPACLSTFSWLESLDIANNCLSALPELPPSLKKLWASQNRLTALPVLPPTLTLLSAGDNQLTQLPELPPGLQVIAVGGNRLKQLPVLPQTLCTLGAEVNQLEALPPLPNSLTTLWINQNRLTTLPALPAALTALIAYDNHLTTLPALPVALSGLWVHQNRLLQLPELPAGLTTLWANDNLLESLPSLRGPMIEFNIRNNGLSQLPPAFEAMMAGGTVDVSHNRWTRTTIQRILTMQETVGVIYADRPVIPLPVPVVPVVPAAPETPYAGPLISMKLERDRDAWHNVVADVQSRGLGRLEMRQCVVDFREIFNNGNFSSYAEFDQKYAHLLDGSCANESYRLNYLHLIKAFSHMLSATARAI